MNLQSTFEGVQIALEQLRADKVRAFLTILGIGIGVATVTGMGAVIAGVQGGINADLQAIGPENFVVMRFDQTLVRMSGPGKPPWEGKPKISPAEARVLADLPSIQTVTVHVSGSADAKAGSKELAGVEVEGIGPEWPTYMRGDFIEGRNFLPVDEASARPVAVITEEFATRAFGEGRPAAGRQLRLGGNVFEVLGVYRPAPNLFQGGKPIWAAVPSRAAMKYLSVNDDFLELWMVTRPGYSQAQAMDETTIAMRTLRRLKPGQEDNFALVRQEALADMINGIMGVIYIVMLVLSSIGLLVGGVGVVGIMMISVTERTREIGVRKALGARRFEILWQFLVEAITVTVVGASAGLIFGAGGAMLLRAVTPVPAVVPVWSVAAALGVAIFTGVIFGIYPAWKASRLDPVVALRYE